MKKKKLKKLILSLESELLLQRKDINSLKDELGKLQRTSSSSLIGKQEDIPSKEIWKTLSEKYNEPASIAYTNPPSPHNSTLNP